MSLSVANNSTTPSDIYLQLIPQFILRQFHFVPSDNLRKKVRNLWRPRHVHGEQVFVYDITSCRLHQNSVRRSYGGLDAFSQSVNSPKVEELASRLSDFEREAANIVLSIHYGISNGCATLSRLRLSTLRKFLFVSHYRRYALDIQDDSPSAEQTKSFNSWQSKREAWLQGLKYYLDRPHHHIVATGEGLKERYGVLRLSDMLKNRSYPLHEELPFRYALEYGELANQYFLGVWIAAEETEFVLSGHTFSLTEGYVEHSVGGVYPLHHLHVLTPRIAVVLRRVPPTSGSSSIVHSSLGDVPMSLPEIRYAKENLEDDPGQDDPIIIHYRTTDVAEDDSFTYSYTQLSPQQTYSVNEVVLIANLTHRGSVIFRQPSAMQQTLDLYLKSPNTTILGVQQNVFRSFRLQLDKPGSSLQDSGQVSSSLPSDQDGDFQLNLILSFIVQDLITFPSVYTRSVLFFNMATATSPSSSNPTSLNVRNFQNTAIEKLQLHLDPPLPDSLGPQRLVRSLSSDESDLFFSFIIGLLGKAGLQIHRTNNLVATVIDEAAIIGVAYWLAEERPDVLMDLIPWVTMLD